MKRNLAVKWIKGRMCPKCEKYSRDKCKCTSKVCIYLKTA